MLLSTSICSKYAFALSPAVPHLRMRQKVDSRQRKLTFSFVFHISSSDLFFPNGPSSFLVDGPAFASQRFDVGFRDIEHESEIMTQFWELRIIARRSPS